MFVTPGFTFTDGVPGQLSSTALHAFMASALATSLQATEWRTTAHIVITTGSTPGSDQGEGSLWFDTNLNLFRVKNNGRWDTPYGGPEMQNVSASLIKSNALVCVSTTDNGVFGVTLQADPGALGIAAGAIAAGGKGIIVTTGMVPVRCKGPVTRGDVLIAAGTVFGEAGWAMAATMVPGYGNTSFTGGIEIGMSMADLALSTGLCTALMWR